VLFFGLSLFIAPPGNFSADALGCIVEVTVRSTEAKKFEIIYLTS